MLHAYSVKAGPLHKSLSPVRSNRRIYRRITEQQAERKRAEMVREFQGGDQCNVLLMSIKAGGLGLTLTRAHYVFHFDLWWNPATATQAEDRAHRIGQT